MTILCFAEWDIMVCVVFSAVYVPKHCEHDINCDLLSSTNISPTHLPGTVCQGKVDVWARCLNSEFQSSCCSVYGSDGLPFTWGADTPQKGSVLLL